MAKVVDKNQEKKGPQDRALRDPRKNRNKRRSAAKDSNTLISVC
jgi:hypothetical protein